MYGPPNTPAKRIPRSRTTVAVRVALFSIVAVTLPFSAPPTHAGESQAGGAECAHRHDAAIRALAAQRYALAYACFSALADRGDAKAAQMALALVRYRPSASNDDWSATPAQQQFWQQLVGAGYEFGPAPSAVDGAG